MAKFYGRVGFITTVETAPGVWEESVIERNYYGDVVRNIKRAENSGGVNDNININNNISLVADPYALENLFAITYIEWMGTLWKITSIEVERPRLILSIGGVYNGQQA